MKIRFKNSPGRANVTFKDPKNIGSKAKEQFVASETILYLLDIWSAKIRNIFTIMLRNLYKNKKQNFKKTQNAFRTAEIIAKKDDCDV
uniref:Uncharacterized protein n=1 Tax=Romanomermis culicivorax TaxID=13658 RepID=A0A915JJR3_ROMCU